MLTMQPSVTLGSYVWAQDRLPYDEYTLRLDELHAAMDRNGWQGVVVYGDVREHAQLAFLTNYIPRVRWAMALLPRKGDARLIGAMSTRDLPAMRGLTWIADVQSGMGPEWDKTFAPWFARFGGDQVVKLGTLGFDIMAPALYQAALRGLGERFRLERADDVLALPSARKRPREVTMIRAACKVLDAAARELVASWRRSHAPETAVLDAEHAARSLAAQDVRTLVSLDGGRTLVPFQGRFEERAGPLIGYLAVKVTGYWSDMFVTLGPVTPASRQCAAALDALIAAARPGARVAALHAGVLAALAPYRLHGALSGSVGHAIGYSLHEGAEFDAASRVTMLADGVYTLQVGMSDAGAGHALLSAMVRLTPNGSEVLLRSPAGE